MTKKVQSNNMTKNYLHLSKLLALKLFPSNSNTKGFLPFYIANATSRHEHLMKASPHISLGKSQ